MKEFIPPPEYDEVLTESARALLSLSLGKDHEVPLRKKIKSYSDLLEQNEQLTEKAADLDKRSRLYEAKYENLSKEFQKVAAERDSLSASDFELNRLKVECEELEKANQLLREELAATKEGIQANLAPMPVPELLDHILVRFEEDIAKQGYKPCMPVPIQLNLEIWYQDQNQAGLIYDYTRYPNGSWFWSGNEPTATIQEDCHNDNTNSCDVCLSETHLF